MPRNRFASLIEELEVWKVVLLCFYVAMWLVWILVGGSMVLYLWGHAIGTEQPTVFGWGALLAAGLLVVVCLPAIGLQFLMWAIRRRP